MSRKSKTISIPEHNTDWILAHIFSQAPKTYPISLNPHSITEKLAQYEGQLILVDREKEILENYGKEGVKYFIAPINTTLIRTVEAGILAKPLSIFQKIPENILENYLVQNPQIGEIFVKYKAEINTFQYYEPQKSDLRFSKENIPLFLEDFVKETHSIYGTAYNTNTESKFYSKVNSLNVMYGDNQVKEFLMDKYKDIGRIMLSELKEISIK